MLPVWTVVMKALRNKNFFHALSVFLYVLALGIVIQVPGEGYYFEGLRALILLAFLSALLFYIIGFNRKFIIFSAAYMFLFVSSSLIPLIQGEIVHKKEIIAAFLFGGTWLTFWSWVYYLGRIKNKRPWTFLCGMANLFRILALLGPLLLWGYYVVSGGYAISSAVLLTLFQTNWNESISYLRSQNLWIWGNDGDLSAGYLMVHGIGDETVSGKSHNSFFLETAGLSGHSFFMGRTILNGKRYVLCACSYGHGNPNVAG